MPLNVELYCLQFCALSLFTDIAFLKSHRIVYKLIVKSFKYMFYLTYDKIHVKYRTW